MASGRDRPINLLQVSDIHFQSGVSETALDPFTNARRALIVDVETLVAKYGPVDRIIVSGDIAFAGKTEEYEMALRWLLPLCSAAGADLGKILVVPGNHDIDCDTIHATPVIEMVQQSLRTAGLSENEAEARKYLLNRESVEVLLRPHLAYNEFAARFECHISGPEGLHWEKAELPLNDGRKLVIRGMTSTLCSDWKKDADGNLFINRSQYEIFSDPSCVFVVVSHHPPEWTSARDAMNDGLRAAAIQLFGHKHLLRPMRHGDSVRIGAGAVQPEGEGRAAIAAFGYSMLQLRVEDGSDRSPTLVVTVLPRRWASQPPPRYEADRGVDGSEEWIFKLPLPRWTGAAPAVAAQPAPAPPEQRSAAMPEDPDRFAETRSLFLRFFALPYSRRFEICGKLNVVVEDDRGLPDYEKFVRALRRAIDGGRKQELAQAISEAEARG